MGAGVARWPRMHPRFPTGGFQVNTLCDWPIVSRLGIPQRMECSHFGVGNHCPAGLPCCAPRNIGGSAGLPKCYMRVLPNATLRAELGPPLLLPPHKRFGIMAGSQIGDNMMGCWILHVGVGSDQPSARVGLANI